MNKFIGLILLSILFVQCGQDKDTMILKSQLGEITKDTSIEDLDKIFKNDSVEKYPLKSDIKREYRVYGADGKMALSFLTRVQDDSIKGLELVKIYSDRYLTEKGISTKSSYKDVADNYSIDKIETSFSAAILFVDELNATVLLNKSDLNLDEFDMREIRADQIPDEARINYISLWFD